MFCRWHGEFRNCSEMFKVTKTDDGFCCSFNTVSLSEGFAKSPTLEGGSDNEDDYEDFEYEEYIDYGDQIYDDVADVAGETGIGILSQNQGENNVSLPSTEYTEDWWVILFKFELEYNYFSGLT
jgi:hypothetical protein